MANVWCNYLMSDQLNIEINGVALQVEPGTMVIEAADDAGITIPRFCYHKKLSVAANCRMCLVEVEKAPKPLPACATPVTDGMKIMTKSPLAIEAQKSVMEFLLINHPLDCPICDQGGECDLQDVAMGYGQDMSRYHEKKRVVKNKYLGSLISTDMTRCIHCTRCVRFGQEVAGIMEMGMPGRGEHSEISTYMERAVGSEMSGNVIDLCPVGALTSKPYRYSGRPWENTIHDSIAPHDCVGSNVHVETRRNKVMRVLPKENEAINELWLSDRDRFSYTSLTSSDRLTQPMIKQGKEWKTTDWQNALNYVVEGLNRVKEANGADHVGALASPSSTTEEFYLLQKVMRGLGSNNIDHRLQQIDFRDQDNMPAFPCITMPIAEIENIEAGLLIGSFTRKDQPIIAHRLRKAAIKGANISAVNSIDYDFNFELAQSVVTRPDDVTTQLAGILNALAKLSGKAIPEVLASSVASVDVSESHRVIAEDLNKSEKSCVLIGLQAMAYTDSSAIQSLANAIAELSDSHIGYLSAGANSAGAWLAGAIPHRGPGAKDLSSSAGKNALQMITDDMKSFVLLNVEPEYDCANPDEALSAMNSADFVVCLSPFATDTMREYADVLLPIATYTETSGTFVNVEGKWQSFQGSIKPAAETRPAWKVLRVIGNFLKLDNFEYLTSEDIRDELDSLTSTVDANARRTMTAVSLNNGNNELTRIGHLPLYAIDSLVRRAAPLQETDDALGAMIAVNKTTAKKLGLDSSHMAVVMQSNNRVNLPIYIEDAVPDNCAFIPTGVAGSVELGISYGPIEVDAG
ncbi:NADH-ubiquinone oxidoreductase chain G [hydrothermal vent metagenome]|uniref:NADH-ubiquinone oxidoreductase chain G n=1 Tax=hydrothermal vent metagenome TaxID=652676 RepID=A0A3B1A3Q9_9ZZZZ